MRKRKTIYLLYTTDERFEKKVILMTTSRDALLSMIELKIREYRMEYSDCGPVHEIPVDKQIEMLRKDWSEGDSKTIDSRLYCGFIKALA